MKVVSVSGGKDSTATAGMAIQKHGKENCRFVFADTGNEHEATYEYIYNYLPKALDITIDVVRADFTEKMKAKRNYIENHWPGKGVPDDIVRSALSVMQPTGNPFLDLCLWKNRFPSRKAQFCTQELKRYPLDNHNLELISQGYVVESWQGVRRDESEARKFLPETEMAAEGWLIVRPIIDWNIEQVIQFVVVDMGIRLNPLYSQGMGRVGCMPCINCNKNELSEIAARFPHHIDRIREWEQLIAKASKRGFTTFFCGSAMRSDVPLPGYVYKPAKDSNGNDLAPYVEGDELIYKRYNIDEMVRWSRTSRGGKHFDLFKGQEESGCTSIYGLCE